MAEHETRAPLLQPQRRAVGARSARDARLAQPQIASDVPTRPPLLLVVWATACIGLALIVYFDLGPPLAFNDDWGFAWVVRHLTLPRIQLYPSQSALALVQILWAALVTAGHSDQRVLRLSILPFVLLAAASSYHLAGRLGADRFWRSVSAAVFICSPILMSLTASFMTDVPFIALLLASAAAGAFWIQDGRLHLLCVLFAVLATLQRQVGVLIPIAVTCALLAARRSRVVDRSDWAALTGLWCGCVAALAMPMIAGFAPPTEPNRVQGVLLSNVALSGALVLVYLPSMVGLVLSPFAAALVANRAHLTQRRARLWLPYALLVIAALTLFPPGNYWSFVGLGPLEMLGSKPRVLPIPVLALIEVAAAATTVGLALGLPLWHWITERPAAISLLVGAVSQVIPLAGVPNVFDRYYLPGVALLVPLLAAFASSQERGAVARIWAVTSLAIGVVIFAPLEQDYQAWQAARYQAASAAYQLAPPDEVQAGYAANAVYVEVPVYERSGHVTGALRAPGQRDVTIEGPLHPRVELQYAGPNDPRPGVSYSSAASGRIVIVVRSAGG